MKVEKMNGETLDITKNNIEKLKEIFPDVFTEGKIDFEALKENLGEEIETENEKYYFSWNGKRQAKKIAREPSKGTLRPAKEDSKDWDNTENLYIEGDNLEVLKLLQKSYYEQVKMIYIDPPYNTGNDIIYKNDFSNSIEYYKKFTGQINDENFVMTTNSETVGRYHSNWLNMMYPIIKLSKNLLCSNGLFVVAIDDYEQSRLKLICDEIFGDANFIGTVITRCNPQGRGKKNIDPVHEYHLIYSKNNFNLKDLKVKKRDYVKNDFSNLLRSGTNSRREERPKRFYPILIKNNKIEMISKDEYNSIHSKEEGFNDRFISDLRRKYEKKGYLVVFPIAKNGEKKVWQRTYERVCKECKNYIYEKNQVRVPSEELRTPTSLWLENIYSNVSYGTNLIMKLFDQEKTFDYPKSIYTVKEFISTVSDGIILDFFSGSATTAHAVMKLNAEDGGNRKYIMVQLPEKTGEKSEAFKAGYKNICEIGKERIRRAGEKVKEELEKENEQLKLGEEPKKVPDIGFKVFKLETSNIKEWDSETEDLETSLLDFMDNLKSDRTSLDIVYEVLLKYGLPLDSKIKDMGKFYSVAGGTLRINLDKVIDDAAIKAICDDYRNTLEIDEDHKTTVVLRETSFRDSVEKTNKKHELEKAGIKEIIIL